MAKLRDSLATGDAANALSTALVSWLRATKPTELWQTCATCANLAPDNRMCNKYKMLPPVDVVVGNVLCEGYVDVEEIPF